MLRLFAVVRICERVWFRTRKRRWGGARFKIGNESYWLVHRDKWRTKWKLVGPSYLLLPGLPPIKIILLLLHFFILYINSVSKNVASILRNRKRVRIRSIRQANLCFGKRAGARRAIHPTNLPVRPLFGSVSIESAHDEVKATQSNDAGYLIVLQSGVYTGHCQHHPCLGKASCSSEPKLDMPGLCKLHFHME